MLLFSFGRWDAIERSVTLFPSLLSAVPEQRLRSSGDPGMRALLVESPLWLGPRLILDASYPSPPSEMPKIQCWAVKKRIEAAVLGSFLPIKWNRFQ